MNQNQCEKCGWLKSECECSTWPEPFNAGAHQSLLEQGFIFAYHEESWEDTGDAENGPQLTGGPAYNEYISKDNFQIIIDHNGLVVAFEENPYLGDDPLGDWHGRNE